MVGVKKKQSEIAQRAIIVVRVSDNGPGINVYLSEGVSEGGGGFT